MEQIFGSLPAPRYNVAEAIPEVTPQEEERSRSERLREFGADVRAASEQWAHIGPAVRRAYGNDFQYDPLYQVPEAKAIEETLKERGFEPTDIPLSMWRQIGSSGSQEELEHNLQRVQDVMETRMDIEDKGLFRSFLVELAAFGTDPAALAIGYAGGATAKGRLMKRFLDGGLRTVGANAVIEAALSVDGEYPDLQQLATGMGAAFLLGGGMGAALGPRERAGLEDAVRSIVKGERPRHRWNPDTETWDPVKPHIRLDPVSGEWRSVGAAQVNRTQLPAGTGSNYPNWSNLEDQLSFVQPPSASTAGRFDLASWALRSENPLVQKLGTAFFSNPVIKRGEDAVMALEKASRAVYGKHDRIRSEAMEDAFLHYLKRTTGRTGWWNTVRSFWAHQERDKFMRMVGEYRRSFGAIDVPDEVKQANRAMGEYFRGLLKELQDANVPGARNIQADEWWMPRSLSRARTNEWLSRVGLASEDDLSAIRTLENAFMGAIESGRTQAGINWDPDLSKLVSKAYVRRLMSLEDKGARPISLSELVDFDLTDVSSLRRFLRSYAGLDEDDITKADSMLDAVERLFRKQTKRDGEAATPNILRSRLTLDDQFEFTYRDRQGAEQTARIADFFDNNVEDLAFNYGRSAAGEAAYARYGLTSNDMTSAIDEARALSRLSDTDPQLPSERDVFLMEQMHRAIMGQRPDDMGEGARRLLNMFKSTSFIKMMGSSGINAIVEGMTMVAMAGPMRVLRNMPEFMNIMRGLDPKDPNSQITRQAIMLAGGVGGTFVRNLKGKTHMLDSTSRAKAFSNNRVGQVFGQVEEFVEGSKRAASYFNRLAYITDVTRDMTSVLALDQLDDILVRGAKAPSWWDNRRRSWTLTDRRMKRVQEYLNSDAVTRRNGALTDLGDMPTDVRMYLEDFVFSYVTETIQELDRGNLPFFMQHPMGSLALQFRSFETGAHVRHFLKDVHQGDSLGISKFIITGGMASILYMGRMHAFNMFTPEMLEDGRASLRYALPVGASYAVNQGISALLVDTAGQFTLGENIVNPYGRRTSGLESSLGVNPQSIPGYTVIEDIQTLLMAPGRVARGGAGVSTGISREEARAAFGILGLGTMWFTRPFTNYLTQQADPVDRSESAQQTINLWERMEN